VVACSFPGDGDGEAVVTEAWFGSQCSAQLGRKMPSRFPFAKDIIAHPVRGRAITVGAIKIYLLAAAATNSVFILANELVVLQHDLELGLQGPAHIEQQFFWNHTTTIQVLSLIHFLLLFKKNCPVYFAIKEH
jgi:hypothetical protein